MLNIRNMEEKDIPQVEEIEKAAAAASPDCRRETSLSLFPSDTALL